MRMDSSTETKWLHAQVLCHNTVNLSQAIEILNQLPQLFVHYLQAQQLIQVTAHLPSYLDFLPVPSSPRGAYGFGCPAVRSPRSTSLTVTLPKNPSSPLHWTSCEGPLSISLCRVCWVLFLLTTNRDPSSSWSHHSRPFPPSP